MNKGSLIADQLRDTRATVPLQSKISTFFSSQTVLMKSFASFAEDPRHLKKPIKPKQTWKRTCPPCPHAAQLRRHIAIQALRPHLHQCPTALLRQRRHSLRRCFRRRLGHQECPAPTETQAEAKEQMSLRHAMADAWHFDALMISLLPIGLSFLR